MEEVPEQELPAAYEWFADQIAGHHPSVIKNGKREIGLLKKRGSDKILKPKQEAFRGECEVIFSFQLSGSFSVPPCLKAPILDVDFLILEDVTSTYTLPAILDVKMGRITFDPLANAAKREKEERKYPPQTVLGFRLLGYRVRNTNGKIVVKDKEWGKSFDEHNILDGLLEFFSGRGTDPTLISEALSKLNYVREWFAKQTSFHFYASSLLFVYENDLQKPPNVHLVMIDFSHVFPSNNQLDTNYIAGLNVLHSKMEIILKKFTSTSASQASTH
ncbi:unnamed protein product [Haemonchus placei]|uniref:Kinase n=1 Tax=Haemonchus placei TaxID=6290 RepID=A0A0N4W2S7_HAEPC|nr:unnamed protein product [Haemonchus placei]